MPVWAGVAVSAGLGIYSASKQSKASKDAAQTQAESGDKALALQERIYNQTRDDLAPYRGLGAGAVPSLGNLLGIPLGAETPSAAGSVINASGSLGGVGMPPNDVPTGSSAGMRLDNNGNYVPVNPSIGSIPTGSSYDQFQNRSTYTGQGVDSTSPGGYVIVRGPDGSTGKIPVDQVDAARQAGGTVIGRA